MSPAAMIDSAASRCVGLGIRLPTIPTVSGDRQQASAMSGLSEALGNLLITDPGTVHRCRLHPFEVERFPRWPFDRVGLALCAAPVSARFLLSGSTSPRPRLKRPDRSPEFEFTGIALGGVFDF